MPKTLRDNKGQYAGSIGAGKTRVPSPIKIVKPATTSNQITVAVADVQAATATLEAAHQALKTAQNNLTTAKAAAKRKAITEGTPLPELNPKTIITGTLKDGTTVDVQISYERVNVKVPGTKTTTPRNIYRITGTLQTNENKHEHTTIDLYHNPGKELWYGRYDTAGRIGNPADLSNWVPLEDRELADTTAYRISSFSTQPDGETVRVESLFANPVNSENKMLDAAQPFNKLPNRFRKEVSAELDHIMANAREIANLYHTN